jgi:hypothetical protein
VCVACAGFSNKRASESQAAIREYRTDRTVLVLDRIDQPWIAMIRSEARLGCREVITWVGVARFVIRRIVVPGLACVGVLSACELVFPIVEGAPIGQGGAGGFDGSTDAAGGAAGCGASETACSTGCVNLGEDPAHCGGCERDCGGGQCSGGQCQQVLVAPLAGCHNVVIDDAGTSAYVTRWLPVTNAEAGGVYRVNLTSGESEPLAVGHARAAWIERSGGSLFFSTEQSPPGVWRLPLEPPGAAALRVYPEANDGGAETQLPFGLTTDGADVYFADREGAIGRIAQGGTSATLIYQGLSQAPLTLSVTADFIYFTDVPTTAGSPNDRIWRAPLAAAGAVELVAWNLVRPWGIVSRTRPDGDGGTTVDVFASVAGGAISVTLESGPSWVKRTIGNDSALGQQDGAGLLLSGSQLLWATRYAVGGSIQSYELGRLGSATTHVSANNPIGLARSGDFLYWCAHDYGLVRLRL